MVREVNHSALGLAYDTFHGHIEEKNQAEAINTCGNNLWHVQSSECDRGTPGSGQVHWDAVFEALVKREESGYQGWYSVEAFGRGVPSLAAATRIWRKHFESEEVLAREGLAFVKSSLAKARSLRKELAV
jgi:D-psicose/D-tagatose/L-ribulose 3-epimerase